MILPVKVIPKASRNLVQEAEGRWKVYVTVAPEKGRANKAVIELLAEHCKVPKASVRIIKGQHSPLKTVELITSCRPL